MIRRSFTGLIAITLLMTSCMNQRWTSVNIEKEEIGKIEFFDITSNKTVIYTAGDKSYQSKKGDKKLLDLLLISKFKYKDEIYYVGVKDGKVGVVDRNLKHIVAFNYEEIEKINDKYIKGKRDEKYYLIDMEKYKMLGPYLEIIKRGRNIIQVTELDKSKKLLDGEGKEIENIKAENIFFVREDKIVTRNGNLFGLYDIDDEKYLSIDNEEIYFSGDNILTKKAGIYYLNSEEQDIKRVYPSINDVVLYDYENGFKLLNLKNLKHSNEIYQEIEYNYDRYIIVGKNGKYGVLNKYKQGDIIYEFDYIERVGVNSFQGGTENIGLFALVVEGEKVTEEKYESFIELSPSYYLGLIDSTYYLLDKNGEMITEFKKKDLIYHNKEYLVFKVGDKDKVFLLGSDR